MKTVVKNVAVIGTGPAALMAADILSQTGHRVTVFEKKKGPGRKLLIAGSSGLNITNSLPIAEFLKNYTGPSHLWKSLLKDFSPQHWISFIESLGLSTFEGTSGRYFVKEMKASKLLRAWMGRLTERGVQFYYGHEFCGFTRATNSSDGAESDQVAPDRFSAHPPIQWNLSFLETNRSVETETLRPPMGSIGFDAICFSLGGGSYEPHEVPLRWPAAFISQNIGFDPFIPSNVGYQVDWTKEFLKECEGQPLKNIRLTSGKGTRLGDLVITRYGLEGTPVYFAGETGRVKLDLKPDLSPEQMLSKCKAVKENLSPMRRVKKQLSLCPASLGLLFHFTPKDVSGDLNRLITHIKNFPIHFLQSQSLEEAISSAGGIHMGELNEDLMLVKYPGVFAAGEMLNWDAPTGGFLIQGCVSQGYRAGHGILKFLE